MIRAKVRRNAALASTILRDVEPEGGTETKLDPVATTDADGKYTGTYEIPTDVVGGVFTVKATALGTEAHTTYNADVCKPSCPEWCGYAAGSLCSS